MIEENVIIKKFSLRKIALITGAIGLTLLLLVILLDLRYPDPFFKIAVSLGLILILLTAVFYTLYWLSEVFDALRAKQFLLAAIIFFGSLIWLWFAIR